jgi:hypothetical protein
MLLIKVARINSSKEIKAEIKVVCLLLDLNKDRDKKVDLKVVSLGIVKEVDLRVVVNKDLNSLRINQEMVKEVIKEIKMTTTKDIKMP